MLGSSDHSRYRAGVGKHHFINNEVPEIAYAVKNLLRQVAKPSELDMQDLKHCVRYTLGHSDEWLFPDGTRQNSKDRRGGNNRSLH